MDTLLKSTTRHVRIFTARVEGGDLVPDASQLTLDTPFAGRLTLPRNHLDVLAPQPFGGEILYAGPFTEDGWRILAAEPGIDPAPDADADADADAPANREAGEQAAEPWSFARTAWYSGKSANGRPLVRDHGMNDAALLRFHVSWRSQLVLSVAFHADFAPPPEQDGEDEEAQAQARRGTLGLPYQFGNCYVLNLHSNYAMMYRCGFDEDGKSFTRRMQNSSNSFRLPQVGDSAVELRCDRRSGQILLFIDGEFAMQWDDSEAGYAGKGDGFGFVVNATGSDVRISDILVAEWNGMTDSARSMDAPDRDVILLTNGTDRFSGRVVGIQDDHLELEGSYATMKVPLSKVAEIHFARDALAKAPENRPGEMVVHCYPVGRISGIPGRSTSDVLTLDSSLLGELEVQLDYASILDLQPGHSFIDDWDIEF